MAFKKKPKQGEVVKLVPLNVFKTVLTIRGTSPLVVHNWDEKAKELIRAKQQGKASPGREPKNPEECFMASKYLDAKGRDCIPGRAIKSALVDAASFIPELTKVSLRGTVFVDGELLPLKFEKCVMREDMVRIGLGSADMRYRASYLGWSCDVPLQINTSAISLEQVVGVLQHAGFSIGICEGRPQRNGDWGRFEVDLAASAQKTA